MSDRPSVIRCAAYARYSSDMQRPESIADQIRHCRQEAARQGWVILDEHIYSDEAISGVSVEGRAGLLRLTRAALQRPRPFDLIVVDDTSRLARDVVDAVQQVFGQSVGGQGNARQIGSRVRQVADVERCGLIGDPAQCGPRSLDLLVEQRVVDELVQPDQCGEGGGHRVRSGGTDKFPDLFDRSGYRGDPRCQLLLRLGIVLGDCRQLGEPIDRGREPVRGSAAVEQTHGGA